MGRIPQLQDDQLSPEAHVMATQHHDAGHRITNMKRSLLHSPAAFRALMEWYPLHDEVARFLGPRATLIFAHAISDENDCLICSTYFRREFTASGEHPDRLELSDRENTLIAFGRQLANDPHGVSDRLFAELQAFLSPEEIVTLTTFGAVMIATNVFNDALAVDLDESLFPFRKPAVAAPEQA